MRKLLGRYAAWTRGQASTTNCGHVAGAAVAAAVICVLSVVWVVHRYGHDILQALTILGITLLSIAGAAAACGTAWCGWHVWLWAQHLREQARVRALPRCQNCPAPAPAAAMAVRKDGIVRNLCAACWLGLVHPAPRPWPSSSGYGKTERLPDTWAAERERADDAHFARPAGMTGPLPVHDLDASLDEEHRAAEVARLEAAL
jgi:hypothetical protein